MAMTPISHSAKLDAYMAQIPQPEPRNVKESTIFKVAEIFKKYGLCDDDEIAWRSWYQANYDVHTQRITGGQIHGLSPDDLEGKQIAWMRAPDERMAFMIQGQIQHSTSPQNRNRVVVVLSQYSPSTSAFVNETGYLDMKLSPFHEETNRAKLEKMLEGQCVIPDHTGLGSIDERKIIFTRGVYTHLPIHPHNQLQELCQIQAPITSY